MWKLEQLLAPVQYLYLYRHIGLFKLVFLVSPLRDSIWLDGGDTVVSYQCKYSTDSVYLLHYNVLP